MFRETSPLLTLIPLFAHQSETHDGGGDDGHDDGHGFNFCHIDPQSSSPTPTKLALWSVGTIYKLIQIGIKSIQENH